MHVLVVAALTASSQVANAINTVKMAQGFARLGHKVTIICCRPLKGQVSMNTLEASYGLTEELDWVQLPPRVFIGSDWVFALLAWGVARQIQPDLVFARNYVFPWLTSKLGVSTVAESHAHVGHRTFPFLTLVRGTKHQAFRLLITISHRLADYYQTCGVPGDKLIILPDAVDLQLFQRPLVLPPSPFSNSGKNVVYAGHLYNYKGIPSILEAARLLPDLNFHLVGGWPKDVEQQQRRAQKLGVTNVTFHGLKHQSILPSFLWHANVLLLPPSQYHPSAAWTSPLKLGEYLASGTPVVVTDIPALRDWLTNDEVEFVSPDDAEALAKGIRCVLSDKAKAETMSTNGLLKAKNMSYTHRAQVILRACDLLDTPV